MLSMKGQLRFIGVVENANKQEGRIKVFPEYCSGLRGIDAFSHVIVLYWAHLRDTEKERNVLLVFPRRHKRDVETGVFACRSPSRPNPICLCVVELVKVEECALTVRGLDAFKGSPVIDIKPYSPRADSIPNARVPEWASNGSPT
ncbi:tRNA (N6-threonylcarbamoyladenosine(37)-N6)-methyltransferase TrmO [Candidatus Bathyarchaeota archaeon]|nr:tRNA (N6-threonylcarbamoyladenosine(37)-N6)-methyltransferase TrmO [Candidatus Bathyarchaeota archaeon]